MITLDLPPQIEQHIIERAEQKSLTVNELILQWANQDKQNNSILLTDFVKTLPNRSHIGNGLAIQKALRDEWD